MKLHADRQKLLTYGAAGIAVAALAVVAYGIYRAAVPASEPLQGMVFAKTVDVASKIPGRVLALEVAEGADVKAGDVLLKLDIPEIEAKLNQVRAKESAAREKLSLVQEGARAEEIAAAREQVNQAASADKLASDTFARMAALFKDGLISKQNFEEVKTKAEAAHYTLLIARQKLTALENGARNQEKAAAQSLLEEASQGVAQVASLASESQVLSPIAGEVSKIHVEAGEIAPAGFALMSVVDLKDVHVRINVREDVLSRFSKGAVFKALVPAVSDRPFDFKVYFISPRGEYATWRATRQNTGYDLKTFEVRARPVNAIAGLRPGMSVILK